jgi:hypothetical protein
MPGVEGHETMKEVRSIHSVDTWKKSTHVEGLKGEEPTSSWLSIKENTWREFSISLTRYRRDSMEGASSTCDR